MGNARGALEGLTASGRFGPDVIAKAAQAVVLAERVTSQSADEIVKDFSRMGDGVAKWAEEHNKSMHFVSAPQYAYIKQLEEQGRAEQAEIEVLRLYTAQFGKVNDKLSDGAKFMRDLKQASSEFIDSIQGIGRTATIGDQIDDLTKKLARMKEQAANPMLLNTRGDAFGSAANIAAVEEQRRTLQRQQMQQEGLAASMARDAAIADAGIAAKGDIDALLKKAQATSALAEAMKKYHAEVEAASRAHIPYSPSQVKAGEAQIRKDFSHPADRFVGQPNTPQEDFRTSELSKNDGLANSMREASLKVLEEQNAIMAHIHELDSAQEVFRRSELDDQEKVDAALREQQQIAEQANAEWARKSDMLGGMNQAMKEYVDNTRNAAAQGQRFVTDATKGMEDAFVQFATTGKFSMKSMVDSMIADLIRLEAQKMIASMMGVGSSGGSGSSAGGVASMIGSIDWSNLGKYFGVSFANGIDYVPYDGFPAILHEGEKVTRRQDAAADRKGSGGDVHIHMGGMTFGAGVDAAGVAQAVRTGMAKTKAEIQRSLTTNGRLS